MQYLGQHFLKNTKAIDAILGGLNVQPGETIIEIGPGKGALTLPLLELCKNKNTRYIGIEKDSELASSLESEIKNKELGIDAKIITGDALKEIPSVIHNSSFITPDRYAIVGNIPYYITGHLLRIIGELKHRPRVTVLMIQKEVAVRLSSKPPKMNLLSAATQVWARVEILERLKPQDFDPPPEVDSAIIKLTPVNLAVKNLENYYKTIHAAFKQPRKTLVNNLSESLAQPKEKINQILTNLGLSLTLRAQNLSIEELIKLSNVIY